MTAPVPTRPRRTAQVRATAADGFAGWERAPGTATGPLVEPGFPIATAVPSWNATTPPGTWIETLLRARIAAPRGEAGRFTGWYHLGVWAADGSVVRRHSVAGQRDDDASVAVDTLVLADGRPADAVQMRVRLRSAPGVGAAPTLRRACLALASGPAPWSGPSPPGDGRGVVLDVPRLSQRVAGGSGESDGDGWCSAASVAMLRAFWRGRTAAAAGEAEDCDGDVRAAVDGVFDHVSGGTGNWAFNVAWLAAAGLEAEVALLGSIREAAAWTAAGVPLVLSLAWDEGGLTGAPIPRSDGHLVVLAGFDAAGDPVVNDPAAPVEGVRRTYPRAELERLWLTHSGGATYVAFPPGHAVPR